MPRVLRGSGRSQVFVDTGGSELTGKTEDRDNINRFYWAFDKDRRHHIDDQRPPCLVQTPILEKCTPENMKSKQIHKAYFQNAPDK